MKKTSKAKNNTDYEQVGKMIAQVFESGYANRRRVYTYSFIKGVISGAGGVLGATIVISLLVWFLSIFTGAPILGPLFERAQDSVKSEL